MEQVVIIGTGCAGLTAAIYTARANLNPLVLTGTLPGGLLTTTTTVENFPGFPKGIDGYELMQNLQEQATRFGARIEFATLDGVDFTKQPFQLTMDGKPIEARTVIVATGSSPRRLGIATEATLENRGVTYCATCDGALPQYRNKPLVVVGGGDSALEEAQFLTRFGSEVHLVVRRNVFRASVIMQERAKMNPKIKIHWNSVVDEILDVEKGVVTAVRLLNPETKAVEEVPCAGVFVAIGHKPNTAIFKGALETDDHGYIKTFQGTQTNIPGVFVAGDVADPVYRQAITAAGTGCAAAIDAERYLAHHFGK